MVNLIRIAALAGAAALVAGCGQRAEPVAVPQPAPIIQPEPSFNKF
jgi:hypothetical protein